MNVKEVLKPVLASLPDSPGVYQYFDREGKIIYIGKAKNLKKRVRSYFNKEHGEGKINLLVRRIEQITYVVVKTEWDALLLENNLIKKYQPRYNVMLKDDKTYPWICIKNEPFPRLFSTRRVIRDGSAYFGPYTSVRLMNTVLDFIKQLYPLRTCNLNLTETNIEGKKFKRCLEYHIGNCKGPCEGLQTKQDYDNSIAQIKHILQGNIHGVIQYLKRQMEEAAGKWEFDKAQLLKEKLLLMEKFQSRSAIVHPSLTDVDVFSVKSDEKCGFVNFLKIVNGAVIQCQTIELNKKLDEPDQELLMLGIAELRQHNAATGFVPSKEIILPFKPDADIPDAVITVPQKGDKKRLLELSENNLRYYMREKDLALSFASPEQKTNELLTQMQKDLRMTTPPVRIECFDNSNIQGAYPVAAMTVFINGKPAKSEYRHFNIKTVEGPNDFASMEEVIYRRYKRLIDEKKELPQLIVIDGGKGQLRSALKSLERLNLSGSISIIGIAKRLEEIFFPGDPVPLYLDKRSPTLKIIQQIRDEAHRFGISHHRNKRSKGAIQTSLTGIEGIGGKTAEDLLRKFGSVQRLKDIPEEEIAALIGKAKAQKIKTALS